MREKQLLIDFLCASAGGPMYYRGRDMTLVHKGMRINENDWNVFLGHAAATLAKFQVPDAEQREVVAFVQSIKKECVDSSQHVERDSVSRNLFTPSANPPYRTSQIALSGHSGRPQSMSAFGGKADMVLCGAHVYL